MPPNKYKSQFQIALKTINWEVCLFHSYEKSETHRFEVPRMLFDEPQALEGYIMKTKDKWVQGLLYKDEPEFTLKMREC